MKKTLLFLPVLFIFFLFYRYDQTEPASGILLPSGPTLTMPDTSAFGTLSHTRIEFSHGPASGQTVNARVKLLQTELLSKYNALAVDLESQAPTLYLTFDCGYEYEGRTDAILDILKQEKIPAAFFLVVDFAELEPELTQRIIDEGHIIGNHSASHKDYTTLSDEAILQDLTSFDQYMKDHFHYTSDCFRFPSGVYSEYDLAFINAIGYRTFFWSCAYADWDKEKGIGADAALEILKDRLHPGAILLLHPVCADAVQLLSGLIDYAKEQGYTFAPLP